MRATRFPVLLFAAIAAGFAQSNEAARVDAVFSRYNHTTTPGCTVGVSKNGKPVLERAYGMSDLEHAIALTPDTILEAGSVSKQFTAAAVLLLEQDGKLSIDDPVRKYIPELPDYGTPLTIRQMLNHTSGLRDWGAVADIGGWPRTTRAYTHDHVLEILSRQQSLNYPPGAHYSYSNSGYNLAAILVSRVAGKPFAAFTAERIFEPMGMTSTSWRDDYRRIVPKRAMAYADSATAVRQLMPFENVHGNGGLLTTVGDLLRWNTNFTSKQVGGARFAESQLQRAKLTDGTMIHYAAGLQVGEYRGEPEVSHSGATAGYRAWLARYPKADLSVAVLCNAGSADAPGMGRATAAVFLNLPTATRPAATGSGSAASVAGLYRSRRDHTVTVVEAEPAGSGALRMGPRRFVAEDGNGSTFVNGDVRLRFDGEGARETSPSGETRYDRVKPWTPAQQDLEAMTGEYRSDEAEVTLRVALEGGRLIVLRRPAARLPLQPTYQDGFASPALGSVRFVRGAGGRVVEMHIGSSRVWDLRLMRVAGSAP